MKKLVHILTGWGKVTGLIKTTLAEKKLSDMRINVCRRCDSAKSKKVLEILNGEARYENSLQCTICKCPCLEKSLVTDEQCPLSKW